MRGAQTTMRPLQSLPDMPIAAMGISDREFRLIRDLVYKRFGINLTPEKRALLVGRLWASCCASRASGLSMTIMNTSWQTGPAVPWIPW